MAKLVKKDTNEQVKITSDILADGRTLVQHVNGGRIEVLSTSELAVVDDQGNTRDLDSYR